MNSSFVRVGLIILVATIPAAAGQGAPRTAASRKPDFRVVFWHRRDQPIETFRYQVYDVRKGEYTSAVVDWADMMRARYPAYVVLVRDVDLEAEEGPNETRKVGAVIHRELLAAAAEVGVFVGPLGVSARSIPTYAPPEVLSRPGSAGTTLPVSPLAPMFNQNPPPAGFPVPMPYPRPHP